MVNKQKNDILRRRIRSSSIFAVLFSLTLLNASEQVISYNSAALEDFTADTKSHDFASNNPIFTKLCTEIEQLKKNFPDKKSINFKHQAAQDNAPILYKMLYQVTKKLSNKAGLEMPELVLSIGNDELYNAAAKTTVITQTTTYSDQQGVVSQDVNTIKKCKLLIDLQTLLLCLWRIEHCGYLSAIIAHELGHFHHNHHHQGNCPEHELEADTFATKILDKPDSLKPALELITLAKCMHSSLDNPTTRTSMQAAEKFEAIRKVANKIMFDHKGLGSLSTATSSTYIQSMIDPAIKKALKNSAFKPYQQSEHELLNALYEKLTTACIAPAQLVQDPEAFSRQCKDAEDHHHYFNAPKTHPPLGERLQNIARSLKSA